MVCRVNPWENLWAPHLLYTIQISVHTWWQQPTRPAQPYTRHMSDCWQSNLNVLFLEKTHRTAGKSFFFPCFFPEFAPAALSNSEASEYLGCQTPRGRQYWTIFFWVRCEGQNLFHIADTWHSCQVTAHFVDTSREKDLKMQIFLFKLTRVRYFCHVASHYAHNLSILWNLILCIVIRQLKKNLT